MSRDGDYDRSVVGAAGLVERAGPSRGGGTLSERTSVPQGFLKVIRPSSCGQVRREETVLWRLVRNDNPNRPSACQASIFGYAGFRAKRPRHPRMVTAHVGMVGKRLPRYVNVCGAGSAMWKPVLHPVWRRFLP